MKLKYLAIALAALLLGIAGAAVVEYYHPQTATGAATISLARYLNGTLLAENEAIDWGTVNSSTSYVNDLNVKNTGNVNVTIYLYIQNLPLGWTETWTANATLTQPNQWANGTLTLTTGTVQNITYTWDSWITASP